MISMMGDKNLDKVKAFLSIIREASISDTKILISRFLERHQLHQCQNLLTNKNNCKLIRYSSEN